MRNSSAHFALGDNVVGFTPTVHDFLEQSCTVDTVGEFPKQRAYAFYPTEFKELTRLKLNSPTVSLLPKAYTGFSHPSASRKSLRSSNLVATSPYGGTYSVTWTAMTRITNQLERYCSRYRAAHQAYQIPCRLHSTPLRDSGISPALGNLSNLNIRPTDGRSN